MKITDVSPQKKNPKRFNVFLDGQFAFGADEDLVINYRLLPGKEITKEMLDKLLYEAEVGKLMDRMYRLINIRQRSEKEIRDYFKKLNFKRKLEDWDQVSDLVVDQVVERLKVKGLINDEMFALAWVDARRRSKKKGSKALEVELLQKGIDKNIIKRILEENPVDEEKLARETLEKKLKIWKNLPDLDFRKKATDFLLRKGFDFQTIRRVIEELKV